MISGVRILYSIRIWLLSLIIDILTTMTPWKKFFFFFFLLPFGLFAADFRITGKEAGGDFRGEFNRALLYSVEFSALGSVELNELYTFKGGLALGGTGDSFDIKTLIHSRIGPLFNLPLYFGLAYIYNGLPVYEAHSHTILPLVYFSGRWAGISLGPGLRFTRFFGETTIFESIISFSAYVNFIDREKLRMGIGLANFGDFIANNMGAYSLSVNSLFRFNKQWSMINNLELLQSGSVGMAANFYGIAYRGGVRYTW